MFSHNRFSFGVDGTEGNLWAAPVVGPSGRVSAPPSRPNDLNSTTKITHSIFFYPSVSTFTSAAKNRSSDNFLIQKNILIFCTKSKIPDSPSMLYYRLCCIIRRPFFGRLGGAKQHFVEELEGLDV